MGLETTKNKFLGNVVEEEKKRIFSDIKVSL